MSEESSDINLKGKGQAERLGKQHELAGGPLGIFGEEAQKHDASIRDVVDLVGRALAKVYPNLNFRHRTTISKKEINGKLASIDPRLGQVLFVDKASIKPDGGIIEVCDKDGIWRVILVGESKHQGNDVEKIVAGVKQGKNKDADLMVAGNAIERVHKNILEFRNLMLDEIHFPYVVFLQGSNFATKTFFVKTPGGREVKIAHDAGNMNRIDRVTSSSFGMPINMNYCENQFIEIHGNQQMLQIASLYFKSDPWAVKEMSDIMWEISLSSLELISESLATE